MKDIRESFVVFGIEKGFLFICTSVKYVVMVIVNEDSLIVFTGHGLIKAGSEPAVKDITLGMCRFGTCVRNLCTTFYVLGNF